MRLKKDTIGSMLQGVSEQPPSRRDEGQNTAQVNMLSDAASGLRRRDGLKFLATITTDSDVEAGKVYGSYQATKNGYKHLIINTASGEYFVVGAKGISSLTAYNTPNRSEYLSNSTAKDIQSTSCSGVTYIVNTAATVEKVFDETGRKDPNRWGFITVIAGAYDTKYTVQVSFADVKVEDTYQTPSGNLSGHAGQSTPSYIAAQLKQKLEIKLDATTAKGKYKIYVRGSYLAIESTHELTDVPMSVQTEISTAYLICSGRCNIQTESALPARLPVEADGFLCSVGATEATHIWYRYDDGRAAWIECGAWGSPTDTNKGTPLKLNEDGTLEHMVIEGRNAGNDENNESPQFLKTGEITGIGTYSGRLVFLSGAYVSMSAAGKPRRFYRTTVSNSLGSDRVDLASGSAQNTIYRQAVQYNKDLLVIGDDAQAVIPFSTTKASDSVALVITSTMTCNSTVTPTQTLKTLLYPTGADVGYSNVLELTPSTVSSSLYSTDDATSHIPRYIKGDIRFMGGNPNWGLNFIGTVGEPNTLVIHEYLFDGDSKAQNAWHKWVFDREILWAYSGNDYIYILMRNELDSKAIDMYTIDPTKESIPLSVHLDYIIEIDIVNDKGRVPVQLEKYSKDNRMVCVYAEGRLAGHQVSLTYLNDGHTDFVMDRIIGEPFTGKAVVGITFESSVQPTSPITRNREGYAMLGNKEKLLRFEVVAYNSGTIWADVEDPATATKHSMELPAVTVQSSDLQLDRPLVGKAPKFTVPCRTKPQTTQVTLRTNDIHDMHFIACDYLVKKEG